MAYKWEAGVFMLRGVPLTAATIQEWQLPLLSTSTGFFPPHFKPRDK